MNPKDRPWTTEEEFRLRREFANKTSAELAKEFRRSTTALRVKASKMGLKKAHYGRVWTERQLDTLQHFFPTMFNRDLATILQIPMRSMIRKARELGLEKAPTFREDKKHEMGHRVSVALKRKYETGACSSHFKKGVRSNPDGEFKPGYVESPETKAKRSAALKRTHARKKVEARIKSYLKLS